MINEYQKIVLYIKRNYRAIIFLFVVGLLCYYIKMFNYSLSIDTEVTINNVNANDLPWFATGRWFLVILGKILHYGGRFNYFFSNSLMLFFFVASIVILGYTISKLFKTEKESQTLIFLGILILSSPVICEMLGFTMMSGEIAIGLFFSVLAILFSYLAVYKRQRMAYFCSICSLILTMGIYQAFLPLFLCLSAIFFFLEKETLSSNKKIKEDLTAILKIALIFIVAYITNNLIDSFFRYHYQLGKSAYLTNQILWGKENPFTIIKSLCLQITGIIVPNRYSLFFNYSYLLTILLSLYYILKNFIQNKAKSIISSLSLLFILISPFLLNIIIGGNVVVRSMFNLPFVTAILLSFFVYKLNNKKTVKVMMITLIIITSIVQLKNVNDLFYSDYIRYQEDVNLMTSIFNKIDLRDDLLNNDREQTTILFVGYHTPKATGVIARGETLGFSFFEWDLPTDLAANIRIHGLAKTLGINYVLPTKEEVKKAQELMNKMEIYPAKNSIYQMDHVIVIRLN